MRIRVPEHHTVLVDWSGRDQYLRMLDPMLLIIANDMGLTVENGEELPSCFITSQYADTRQYRDVWIDGPDEDAALFKLKYF